MQVLIFEVFPYSGKKRSYNRQTGILIFPPKISERGCGISKFDGGNHLLQLVCFGLGSSLVSRHGQSRLQVGEYRGADFNQLIAAVVRYNLGD